MAAFQRLSAQQAQLLFQNPNTQLIDIRDAASFAQGHIEGAQRIDNENVSNFLEAADKSASLVVCCYHGISSQNAAQFFAEQGFCEVFSLDGGFEGWRSQFPGALSDR